MITISAQIADTLGFIQLQSTSVPAHKGVSRRGNVIPVLSGGAFAVDMGASITDEQIIETVRKPTAGIAATLQYIFNTYSIVTVSTDGGIYSCRPASLVVGEDVKVTFQILDDLLNPFQPPAVPVPVDAPGIYVDGIECGGDVGTILIEEMAVTISEDVTLLIHSADPTTIQNFIDSSSYVNQILLYGSVFMAMEQSFFGDTAIRFDNTSSKLKFSDYSKDSSINLSFRNFTLEFFVRLDTDAALRDLFSVSGSIDLKSSYSGSYTLGSLAILNGLRITSENKIMLYSSSVITGVIPWLDWPEYDYEVESVGILPSNTWCHVAVVKYGDTAYLFIDGIKEAISLDENMYFGSITDDVVGLPSEAIDYSAPVERCSFGGATGYFEEITLTKYAKWLTNFTPPTEPYS